MTLRDILRVKGSSVWTVQEDQSIRQAVRILVAQRIGALLVVDRFGRMSGIISERDIMRGFHTYSQDLEEMPVSYLMTRKVIAGAPEDTIEQTMAVMTENRVRHIPVVGDDGLEGLVSIGDVVKSLLRESEYQIQHLKDFIYGHNRY